MSKKGRWIPRDEKYADDRVMITCNGYIADTKTDDVFLSVQALINKYNEILKENEQLKQTIDRLTLDNTKQKKVLNATKKENKELKRQLDNVDDCLTRDDMVMLRAERGFE